MKLRTHFLAGLIAAAALPAIASAAPYAGLGDIQRRAELGQPPLSETPGPAATAADRTPTARGSRHVDLAELQQRGQMGRSTGSEGAADAFFDEHQRQMNVGVSHIEASQIAARKLASPSGN
jgi:hypothetical protein